MVEKAWELGKSKRSTTRLSTHSLLPTCFPVMASGRESPPLPGDLAPCPEWCENRAWRNDCRNPKDAVHWASLNQRVHVSQVSYTFPGGN